MTSRITGLDTRHKVISLKRPWGPALTEIHVVVVTVRDTDGAVGHGFSWTPQIGARSVKAMLDNEITHAAIDRPADPVIWDELWAHLHEAGGGGVTTIALAGIDLALWDLKARTAGTSIIDLLGRKHDSQPVYGSGVNRHYSLPELVAQAERWVKSGYNAMKIKVGRDDLATDIARVGAVRELIGDDRRLMVDANQLWDLEMAKQAARRLEDFDVYWLEEPLRADDTAGYIELRRSTSLPVALGENAHTWYRFRDLIDAGACDIVQPNVIRVGGITPFLRIVELARDRGVTPAPHLLPELSAPLAMTLPDQTWVEDVEDAAFEDLGALTHPTGTVISNGRVTSVPVSGIGIEFN